jgi:toxin ParE1/3/4
MAEVQFSELAIADFEEIFVYTIETFGELQAKRYKSLLENGCERLAADPRLGRALKGQAQTYYHYLCESHFIFYTKQSDGILVVRVLHAAMDFLRHLPD